VKDRRTHRPDPLTIILETSAILGWITIFGVQIVAWLAAPEMDNAITRHHDIELRKHWLAQWADQLPFLLGACGLLSLLAIIVRPKRSRRKTDPKRWNVFILLGLTFIGFVVYWFQILGNIR
jgi:hypothetical protein